MSLLEASCRALYVRHELQDSKYKDSYDRKLTKANTA